MRIKRLSNQFLINYLFIFFLIIVLAATSYYLYNAYEFWRQDQFAIDLDIFEEDYNTEGLDYAMKAQNFQADDYVIVMTPNRVILDQINAPKAVGESYSEIELQEVVYGDDFYNYAIFYNEDKSTLYLLYIAYVESSYTYVTTIAIIAIILFTGITLLFAKYTSNQVLHPILALVSGVQKIGKGDYATHIAFDASNELNILKDEINDMANKLKDETEKRSLLENNRKQLLRDISHDIRTPLTNILGYSDQLIQQGEFISASQQQSIEIINQYGVSANHLITELFDLSKLELEESILSTESVDIVEFIRLKCIDYFNEFEKRQIEFDVNLPDHSVEINFNHIKIQRVVDNLIQNSLKYNVDNFSLSIQFKEELDHFKLIFADDGIGIPDAYAHTIFEPMVRVEDSRNRAFGGSGLGLSIVKQIVEKHGWSIELSKIEDAYFDSGCTFIISIPKDHNKN